MDDQLRIRILFLEDNPIDAELVARELRKAGLPFTLQRVESEEAFTVQCKTYQPNVILSDYALPAFDGLSALKIAQQLCPDVPFILLSGVLGEETAIDSLRLGATDYVLKQRLARLVPAVTRALREAEEHRERQQAEQALQQREELLAGILQTASEAIISVDETQHIIVFNKGAEELFDYTAHGH